MGVCECVFVFIVYKYEHIDMVCTFTLDEN